MTAGMPVADMTIEKVEVFAEDSPADAEPSDLGGPTEPDDAGVPADVGGDEPVPMGDEPRIFRMRVKTLPKKMRASLRASTLWWRKPRPIST